MERWVSRCVATSLPSTRRGCHRATISGSGVEPHLTGEDVSVVAVDGVVSVLLSTEEPEGQTVPWKRRQQRLERRCAIVHHANPLFL